MSDSSAANGGGAEGPPPGSHFEILKIYAKDLSFETPNSPAVFRLEWKPEVALDLRSESARIAPGQFEVVLSVTVTVRLGEQTAFLAEVQIAGIFAITGLTHDELDPVLGSACPGILYPYARELVSDLTIRGGFPQCLLAPVNFEALYLRQRSEAAAAAERAAGAEDSREEGAGESREGAAALD